ncbi:MAG TPA: TorF family putative porin [Nevskiaceae bacterium]|nr:TorF family putative porin [Nevskiaceae bacterium]
MKRIKGSVAGACALAATLAAGDASAAVVGNVGAWSEYMFRGVEAEGGVAVQGGIDWYAANGFFLGGWASNAAVVGGTEVDVYGGYAWKVNEHLTFDFGAWYYWLPEDEKEANIDIDGDGDSDDLDFLEVFAYANYRWLKLQAYYADEYANVLDEGLYVNAILTIPLKDTLSVALQVGHTSGDGAEDFFGESYTDYSITLNKTIPNGITFGLALMDTDLDDNGVTFVEAQDEPKVVISAKMVFDI